MNLTGSVRVVERGEPFTVREWREMVESRAFHVFTARLDKMIESELHNCEVSSDTDAWRRAQGALKALRTVRSLPEIIAVEATRKML